jgi:hypothetical protein
MSFALCAHMIFAMLANSVIIFACLFLNSTSRVDNNFDLIHCDMWTTPFVSICGYK